MSDSETSSSEATPRSARRVRGAESPQIIVISWRDIPAQVNAQQGRDRQQVILSGKFQRAIDRAKRKAKIYTAHEDIAQWSRVSRPCGSDLAAEALAEATLLEERYTKEHLGRLGFLGGWEPENKPADEVLDETDDEDEDDADEPDADDSSDWGTWSSKPEEQVNPLAEVVASTEANGD
jgi:Virulence factor